MTTIKVIARLSLDGVIAPSRQGENTLFAQAGWTDPDETPATDANARPFS